MRGSYRVIALIACMILVSVQAPGRSNAYIPHEHPKEKEPYAHQHSEAKSEINTEVTYADNRLSIQIKDKDGRSPDLVVNHEKEMHLIIVSRDLKSFFHVHPERLDNGVYTVDISLPEGEYRVFVDITLQDQIYVPASHALKVGHRNVAEASPSLTPGSLSQEIEGRKVTLEADGLNVHGESSLRFDLHGAQPDPYLGAKGHVVLIDEAAETYIHVHPVSDDALEFSAHFTKPGRYKLWAEFNYPNQGVVAFPFIIEVPAK